LAIDPSATISPTFFCAKADELLGLQFLMPLITTTFGKKSAKIWHSAHKVQLKKCSKISSEMLVNRTASFVPVTLFWRLCELRKLVGQIDPIKQLSFILIDQTFNEPVPVLELHPGGGQPAHRWPTDSGGKHRWQRGTQTSIQGRLVHDLLGRGVTGHLVKNRLAEWHLVDKNWFKELELIDCFNQIFCMPNDCWRNVWWPNIFFGQICLLTIVCCILFLGKMLSGNMSWS